MDFEKQFPSLKTGKPFKTPLWFSRGHIESGCVDKQKVKEVMDKFEEQTKLWACNNEVKYTLKWLKQELGLED